MPLRLVTIFNDVTKDQAALEIPSGDETATTLGSREEKSDIKKHEIKGLTPKNWGQEKTIRWDHLLTKPPVIDGLCAH